MIIALLFSNLLFAQTAPVASFDGNYQRPCYLVDSDALTTELAIHGPQWKLQHYAFEDEKCTQPYLIYEVDYKVKSGSNNAVDMMVTEASYTVLTDEVAGSLNYMNYCGFTDWTANVKKVVTGKQCDDFKAPSANSMIYSIAKVESKDGKTALSIGTAAAPADGKSAESRYNTYDPLPLFKK